MLAEQLKPKGEKEILGDIMKLPPIKKFSGLLKFYFNKNPDFYLYNDGQHFKDLIKLLNEDNLIVDVRIRSMMTTVNDATDMIWTTDLWSQYKKQFNIVLEVHVKNKPTPFIDQLFEQLSEQNTQFFKGKPIEHLVMIVRENILSTFYTE